MCGQSRETTDVCVDQCYISCSLLLWRKKKSSIVKLIVIKWMPDLIEKIVLKRLGTNIIIWNLFVFETKLFILCVIYQNRHWPLGGDRLKSLVSAYLTQTSDTGHMTHKYIELLNAQPSYQFFILLNKLFTRVLILFFYACWLFMNEFVNMFLKSMNEIVHTYCNEPKGRTLCWLVLILTFHVLGIKSGQAFQSVDPLPLAVRLD